jgi:hypothetical protein
MSLPRSNAIAIKINENQGPEGGTDHARNESLGCCGLPVIQKLRPIDEGTQDG